MKQFYLPLLLMTLFMSTRGFADDVASPLGEIGSIRLLVFDAETGAPIPDVTIRVGPVLMGRTNHDGAIFMELFEDLYHFSLDTGDGKAREVALRVLPGEVVEAIAVIDSETDEVALTVEQNRRTTVEKIPDQAVAAQSTIVGTVINEETKAPIAGARVFIRGLTVEATSDETGRFEIAVPVGTHDVVVVHSEFGTVTKSGIEVAANRPTEITIETTPVGVELDELTVTAPRIEGSNVGILEERRETAQVSDVIGAEQMSKTGDSNAAAALKRVTGVTIIGGKYVYVRGLGERYSATLLNRLNLPSPDPERRVVPLDMFPAAILDSVIIQKSFSPDMPAEFGGGVVSLRTKGYPEHLVLKLSLSGTVTTGTTFEKARVASDKGPTDFLGIDGGHRELPKVVEEATRDKSLETGDRFNPGYTTEELAEFSRAMRKNWGITTRRIPPDGKIELTVGNGYKLKKTKLGFLGSLLYKNEWEKTDKNVRDYKIGDAETDELVVNNRYTFNDTTNTITLGGIFAAGVDLGKGHRIKSNTIVSRITDDTFWQYQGFSFDSDRNIRAYNYAWIERMIITEQILGEHLLVPDLGLRLLWRYAFSNAKRNEPDKRMIRYDLREQEGTWMASNHPSGNRRDFLFVNDNAHDMGIDLELPFEQWSHEKVLLKAGGAVLLKKREVDIRRFAFSGIEHISVARRVATPEDFFVDENMTPEGMVLEETTQPTDNYTGEQEIFAGYLMTELPLGLGFKLTGGLRIEQSNQAVSTFSLFSSTDPVEARIDELDFLPAVVVNYEFGNNMVARLGYGKTVNRPDFSEISPGCAPSYAGGYSQCGAWNSSDFDNALKRAVIHNVDLRWEWYPSKGESLSFGGFFKAFIDPLESVVKAGVDKVKFIMNTEGARNFGLELDFRKNFGFLTKALQDVYVAGNATWVRSRVQIPDISSVVQTSKNRALQGQSPFVFNFQLGYDNVESGTSAVLLYNVFGKRVSDVGSYGIPDVFEQPFHELDFIVKQRVKSRFELGFRAQNLLDWEVTFKQGGEVTKQYKRGRSFGLSASFSY